MRRSHCEVYKTYAASVPLIRARAKQLPGLVLGMCGFGTVYRLSTTGISTNYKRLMMAPAYSWVLDFPPKSPVSDLPSASVSKIAVSILAACSFSPICLNIMMELRRRAVGLARAFPAISGAELFVSGELAITSSGRDLELLLPRQVLERANVSR